MYVCEIFNNVIVYDRVCLIICQLSDKLKGGYVEWNPFF